MLFLDEQQGSGHLTRHIPQRHRHVVTHLDSGDAMWVGNGPNGRVLCGAEIKHLSDFLSSMQNGRLPAKQLLRMVDTYEIRYLILHDRLRCDYHGYLQQWVPERPKNMKPGDPERYSAPGYDKGRWADAVFGKRSRILWDDFWAWTWSLMFQANMRLLTAGSNQELARLLGCQYSQWRKPWDKHRSLQVFDHSLDSPLVIPSEAASGIQAIVRGIGWRKALAAAAYFGCIRDAVNAPESEWCKVEGIDKVLAARAVAASVKQHAHRTVGGKGHGHKESEGSNSKQVRRGGSGRG